MDDELTRTMRCYCSVGTELEDFCNEFIERRILLFVYYYRHRYGLARRASCSTRTKLYVMIILINVVHTLEWVGKLFQGLKYVAYFES